MAIPAPLQTLDQALALTADEGPDRIADLTPDFSNAPLTTPDKVARSLPRWR